MNVGMISLGCPKNQVAAEQMLYRLREAGHTIVSDETEADAIIINTEDILPRIPDKPPHITYVVANTTDINANLIIRRSII